MREFHELAFVVRSGELWERATQATFLTAVPDGKLIALSERGELAVVEASPAGYKELARAQVLSGRGKCWTMPVLSGGRIYCRNTSGDLVCLDVKGK